MSNKLPIFLLLATFHLASPFTSCGLRCSHARRIIAEIIHRKELVTEPNVRLGTTDFTTPTYFGVSSNSFKESEKSPGKLTPSSSNSFPAASYRPIANNIPVPSSVTETSNIPETASYWENNNITETPKGPFPSALFQQISTQNENENVILSPFSIQTALTLLYAGAEGKTAEELRTALRYQSADFKIALNISKILNSKSDGKVQLKIATKIYSGYELDPDFNAIAMKYFKSEAEKVDFADSKTTVNKINSWIEETTNNKIRDLLSTDSVNEDTTAILVNAIYFKAQWFDQFSKSATAKRPFWLSETKSVDVDTMFGEMTCKYGEFPEFDATAIELKYEDNDMAMLLLLPNQRQGLKEMQKKLSTADLTQLSLRMNDKDVEIKLPKFKIEFDTQLVPILQKLGMQKAFSSGADYSGLFKSSQPVKVSDVVHKAFIEVNEYGSEAAASTYVNTVYLSSISRPKIFTVDRPFVFAIKNDEAVYFSGHVVKF